MGALAPRSMSDVTFCGVQKHWSVLDFMRQERVLGSSDTLVIRLQGCRVPHDLIPSYRAHSRCCLERTSGVRVAGADQPDSLQLLKSMMYTIVRRSMGLPA